MTRTAEVASIGRNGREMRNMTVDHTDCPRVVCRRRIAVGESYLIRFREGQPSHAPTPCFHPRARAGRRAHELPDSSSGRSDRVAGPTHRARPAGRPRLALERIEEREVAIPAVTPAGGALSLVGACHPLGGLSPFLEVLGPQGPPDRRPRRSAPAADREVAPDHAHRPASATMRPDATALRSVRTPRLSFDRAWRHSARTA